MPHQCVRCGTFYDDGSEKILRGCDCGGKLFFYVKQSKLDEAKEAIPSDLKPEEREQIEHDVLDMVGETDSDSPVVLDFESIKVLEPGKYQLDVVQLFQGQPLVFKLEEGKYVIDIVESFDRLRRKER